MSRIADIAWLALVIVWVAGAVASKRDARRMASGQMVLHFAILGAGLALLMVRSRRFGPLAWPLWPLVESWVAGIRSLFLHYYSRAV